MFVWHKKNEPREIVEKTMQGKILPLWFPLNSIDSMQEVCPEKKREKEEWLTNMFLFLG